MNITFLGLSITAAYSLVFYSTWLTSKKFLKDSVSVLRPDTVKVIEPYFAGAFLLSFFTIFGWPSLAFLFFLIGLISSWDQKSWLGSLKRLIPIIVSMLAFWFLWRTAFP